MSMLAIILFTGCSGGKPSEGAGKTMLGKHIQDESKGNIKLVNFKKTNGQGDEHSYQMEYEAEIEFLANGSWLSNSGIAGSTAFVFSSQQYNNNGGISQLLGEINGANSVQQGQRKKVKGVLQFQKTEKGWRGQDGQIY